MSNSISESAVRDREENRQKDGRFGRQNHNRAHQISLREDNEERRNLYAERLKICMEGGSVPAITEQSHQDPRLRGNAVALEDWWSKKYRDAEYVSEDSDREYLKMPEDYTPGGTKGRSATGNRRTHRRHYEGAGVSMRMPSATSIRRFAKEAKGQSFDVPIEGDFGSGTVSGWVRVTAGADGTWHTQGLGFEGEEQKIADAVGAVLESRKVSTALKGWDSMDAYRAQKMTRMASKMHPVKDSTFISAVGTNPVSGVTYVEMKGYTRKKDGKKVDRRLYAYDKMINVQKFLESQSKGHFYNEEIKKPSQGHHEAVRCENCGGVYASKFGPHYCLKTAARPQPPAPRVRAETPAQKQREERLKKARRRAMGRGWLVRLMGGESRRKEKNTQN